MKLVGSTKSNCGNVTRLEITEVVLIHSNILLPIFTYENNFFIFYNVVLFSVKSANCINFITSFLLTKLIIQQ